MRCLIGSRSAWATFAGGVFAIAIASSITGCNQAPDDTIAPEESLAPAALNARGETAKAESANAAASKQAAAPPAAEPAAACPGKGCGTDGPCECDCNHAKETSPALGENVEQIAIDRAPVRGPAAAPVTIVVFSDFECPFCASAWRMLRELENEQQGRVRVVFKHHPLPMHPHARLAAKAAIAAQAQGKFWEYHEALLNANAALDEAALERHAAEAGLDVERLRRDMTSADAEATVASDSAEASRLGVRGTPTLFLNGRRLIGAQPIEVVRAAVDRVLAKR